MSGSVAILHPGQMGAAVAAQIRRRGTRVLWCTAGRSARTTERATAVQIRPVPDLATLLTQVEVVFSICPPEYAEDVAGQVAAHGFNGLYVEANAISPQRCDRIASTFAASGARVLDASIIGPPPTDTRSARLYLAGDSQGIARASALFVGTSVEAVPVGAFGTASALKMAYASYQKTTRTLAAVAHALAARHGVTDHLLAEAVRSTKSPLAEPDYLPGVAARAWRWAPEMQEIAGTLAADGLPTDLAVATATVLNYWAANKDQWDVSLDAVLSQLAEP